MEVHKLKPNIIANIRSSSTMNSITQCITELVLNSLDARSTAVAVRINFVTFRIQVVDNGDGITKGNLNLIGQRYMTSKCHDLDALESHCAYYGFRGEALSSIVDISQVVKITSKPKIAAQTWSRSLTKASRNNAISVKDRPSCGTTVTIEGFLCNLPLRKKRVNPEVELTHIKRNIECLIIIHPNVSFSLRNDVTGDLILNSRKCGDIISSLRSLHPDVGDDYSLIRVSKNEVQIKGLISKELSENNYKQYIYVNKRPIKCLKIQTFIHNFFQKNKKLANEVFHLYEKNKYHVYVINIKCPYSFVDILLSCEKTAVEFKNWDIVLNCIEKLILFFLGQNEKNPRKNCVSSSKSLKKDCGISQIHGVFKSYGVKRKTSLKDTKSSPIKIQKLINTQTEKKGNLMEVCHLSTGHYVSGNTFSGKEINNLVFTEGNRSITQFQSKQNINSLKNSFHISEFSRKCIRNNSNKISNAPNIKNCMKRNNDLQNGVLPVRHISHKSVQPLPIKVRNIKTSPSINSSKHIPLCVTPTSYKMINDNVDEESLSKFTNDENKGKNLIMDMFLKSTQVFNTDDEYQDDKSEDTVFEEESNYFLKNNVTTNVNGKTKTMSVSINITRTIKKKRNINKRCRTTSKAIQTSSDNNKMVTKCVQTSMCEKLYNASSVIRNHSNDDLAESYTIILSKTNPKAPKFKFVRRNHFNTYCIDPNMLVPENNCKCNCCTHSEKMFNFNNYINNENIKTNGNGHKVPKFSKYHFYNTDLSPLKIFQSSYSKRNSLQLTKQTVNRERDYFRENIYKTVNENLHNTCNPYVSDPTYESREFIEKDFNNFNYENNRSAVVDTRYQLFNPQYESTQRDQFRSKHNDNVNNVEHIKFQDDFEKLPYKNNNQLDKSMLSSIFSSKNVNSYIISDRNMYSPLRLNEDCSRNRQYIDVTVDDKRGGKMTPFDIGSEKEGTLHYEIQTTPDLEDNLFITLSNRQRQNILENELNIDKQLCNINLEWKSQMAITKEKEETKQDKSEEFGQEWIKQQNNFGSNFYINKRTGFTTFYTPKPIPNDFKLCKRFEFMPKGLSPILKEIKEVDESLSQNKKNKLETYILESHQNDLLTIKWQKYIKNHDTKTFFDEMYREKLNSFENCVPSVSSNIKYFTDSINQISFDNTLFDNITVIGQVDRKFIAVIEETKHLLILFDQHAVHERVRLEILLQDYSKAKAPSCPIKFVVFLPCNDLSLLQKYEDYLNFIGLYVEFFEDGVKIVNVPLCLYTKFKDTDDMNSLNAIVQLLIKEIIDLIKETRGVTFKSLPQIIQNIINLEACRGAIKFGDKLSNSDCEQLLKKLSFCNLPFQCAHGRPTLTPLLSLNLKRSITVSKTNLKNIYNGKLF